MKLTKIFIFSLIASMSLMACGGKTTTETANKVDNVSALAPSAPQPTEQAPIVDEASTAPITENDSIEQKNKAKELFEKGKEGIEKGAEATKDGVAKGAEATKDGAENAFDATKEGVAKGADATKKSTEKALDATKDAVKDLKEKNKNK